MLCSLRQPFQTTPNPINASTSTAIVVVDAAAAGVVAAGTIAAGSTAGAGAIATASTGGGGGGVGPAVAAPPPSSLPTPGAAWSALTDDTALGADISMLVGVGSSAAVVRGVPNKLVEGCDSWCICRRARSLSSLVRCASVSVS